MRNFLLGIVVAALVAFGLYYLLVLNAANEVENAPSGATIQVDTGTKKIPVGTVMEDGTLD